MVNLVGNEFNGEVKAVAPNGYTISFTETLRNFEHPFMIVSDARFVPRQEGTTLPLVEAGPRLLPAFPERLAWPLP